MAVLNTYRLLYVALCSEPGNALLDALDVFLQFIHKEIPPLPTKYKSFRPIRTVI
jgi:hypothetical protein